MSNEIIRKLTELYNIMGEFIDLIGLEYDGDEDIYYVRQNSGLDGDDDHDFLSSLDSVYADIQYYIAR